MQNVLLDFSNLNTTKEVYLYLREMLEFSPYCRNNLDDIFDELLEINTETQIYIAYDRREGWLLGEFIMRLLMIFRSAEKRNPRICVMVDNAG